MTVSSYSSRKPKEKEGITKKKIGVGDHKKGKRSAESSDELGTTPPPGGIYRKPTSRYGVSPKEGGMLRLSPQERGSWDEKSNPSKSFQERTPTPESCRHSTPTQYRPLDQMVSRVRALVSANPPPPNHGNSMQSFLPLNAHEGFSNETTNGGFPTPGSLTISPEVEYAHPPPVAPAPAQAKVWTKREESSCAVDYNDMEARHPSLALKSTTSRSEKSIAPDPSDRGSSRASLNIPQHQLIPPMMPDPADLQAWMAAQYEMNGCKGACSRPSKGKRGKKSSSEASSSREAVRMGSDTTLRKKIERALSKHLETQQNDGSSEGGEQKVKQLRNMVDSVMLEIGSSAISGIGTPRKDKAKEGKDSSSSLHTPRGMRSYPMDPMGPQGWPGPCPPHMMYYGQWGYPPPVGMPPPSRQSRTSGMKASIPSPSSAFSSRTCGSGVSSSSFDSGSSRGNYFWPYAQWYPPPWVSGFPWPFYGGMPGMPPVPPSDDTLPPSGI